MRLILATQNAGKLRELAELLPGFELRSLADLGLRDQADETGQTFGENALLKARAAAERTGAWAVADDSGLCVDALDGAPGLYSARFSGRGDDANNALLLEKLAGLPPERRGAKYVCALALVIPPVRAGDAQSDDFLVEAEVRGRITAAPRGSGGFGYDPLFEVPAWGATFAEVDAARKAEQSHRALAARKLLPILRVLAGLETAPQRPLAG